jgi:protein TonB
VPVPTPVPPPPEEPPVVYDEPSPVATPAPPPAPPAPVSAPADFEGGEIDPTGRSMNPPVYPREEQRRGITGTVSLLLTYDANGTVVQVDVIKSSGNRNLDRAARTAAMKWKVNPGMRGGVKVAGKAKTDVDFVLN